MDTSLEVSNAVALQCFSVRRYIIGEIMYGGHVVEDWDRRLTLAYLQTLFQEGLLEGHQLFPQFDFRAPTSNMNHRQVSHQKEPFGRAAGSSFTTVVTNLEHCSSLAR